MEIERWLAAGVAGERAYSMEFPLVASPVHACVTDYGKSSWGAGPDARSFTHLPVSFARRVAEWPQMQTPNASPNGLAM